MNSPIAYRRQKQSGSTLLYIVIAITIFATLAAGTLTYFSSSSRQSAKPNCPALAQYMAEAGIRYAAGQLRPQTVLAQAQAMVTTLQGPTQYTVTDGGSFAYDTITGPTLNGTVYSVTVTCTGTACTGADQSTYQLTSTFDLGISGGGGTGDPETISFQEGDVVNIDPAGTGGPSGDNMVQTNEEDQTLDLGNDGYRSYGCAWYTGDKSPCTDGVCEFGAGFRAYYEVMLSYNSRGDGFVFAIVNAEDNTVSDCGGDPDRGELLAYGGGGNTGEGLEAPKLGLEFDYYANTGTGSVCSVSNRNDYSSADHVAWLFWGHDYWSGGCNETYDDNRHGAGVWSGSDGTPPNADIPTNPENIGESGAGHDGYYYDTSRNDWMRAYNSSNNNKEFRIRIEVDRSQTPNPDGNYCYTLKGWIVKDSASMPEGMDDVETDYYDPNDEDTWPQVEHMVVLSPSKHAKLDNVIFGWTVATGGASQTITISDFELKFKDDETTCPTMTKPDDPVFALPLYEGQGGRVHNTAAGTNAYFNYAYWLKGKSCPECASLFFDDTYGPIVFWDDATRTMTTAGTVSAWVYLKDYDDYMGVLHKGNDWDLSDEVFSLQFTQHNFKERTTTARFNPDRITGPWYRIDDGDEKPIFCLKSGGIYYCVNSQYKLDLDTWYHLAATWNSTTNVMEFFVNGAREATFNAADYGWAFNAASGAYNELVIGAQTSNRFNFQGMIDGVYMYDRVLTDEEILTLYQDGHLTAQEE